MISFFKHLVIASDHAGYVLKENLTEYVHELGIILRDLGTHSDVSVDYPDFAVLACQEISRGDADGAILLCGTGIGISIAANRFSGIRAAVCNDGVTSTSLSRRHNNANILCLGARLVGTEVARDCLKTFITTPFDNSERHLKRLQKLG
jgi:ribose 5-phosphate isomerase B